jgi:hypothetical protein
MKWVRDDLGEPDQARLHVLEKKQMYGAKRQATQTDGEPYLPNVSHESTGPGLNREDSE